MVEFCNANCVADFFCNDPDCVAEYICIRRAQTVLRCRIFCNEGAQTVFRCRIFCNAHAQTVGTLQKLSATQFALQKNIGNGRAQTVIALQTYLKFFKKKTAAVSSDSQYNIYSKIIFYKNQQKKIKQYTQI